MSFPAAFSSHRIQPLHKEHDEIDLSTVSLGDKAANIPKKGAQNTTKSNELQPLSYGEIVFLEDFSDDADDKAPTDKEPSPSKMSLNENLQDVKYRNRQAKFIRVRPDADVPAIKEYMVEKWGMKRPDLLISVTGGAQNESLSLGLKSAFRRGLMKAAESSNAWILTAGTHAGVMKLVGEAVEQFSLIKDKNFVTIGIAPWGRIKNRQIFEQIKGTAAKYAIKDDRPDDGSDECYLDPNHTHFILVDDSTTSFGGEIKLRSNFEKYISEWESKEWTDYHRVPVCLLVLNGGPGTLETVDQGILNKTPTIVIKGSGRIADILADVAANFNGGNQRLTNEHLDNIFKEHDEDYSKWDRNTLNKIQCCCSNNDLFSVYELKSHNSEDDLDLAILRSILNDSSNINNTNKLLLALIWDRFDKVEHYITKTAKTKLGDHAFNKLILFAIQKNRLDFVEHCFNKLNINLEQLFTNKTIAELYQTEEVTKHKGVIQRYAGYNFKIPDLTKVVSKDPFYNLFIWAVLMNYFELSKLFLKHSKKSSIAACLFACAILKICSNHAAEQVLKQIKQNIKAYELLSIELLQQCYSSNRQKTHNILVMVRPEWGNTSCMFMAASSENKLLIAEPACQDLVTNVWKGVYSLNTRAVWRLKAYYTFFNISIHVLFLLLFSGILIEELTEELDGTEVFVLIWVIAFAFEELSQISEIEADFFYSKLRIYLKNGWNWMDLFALLMFIIGFFLRIAGVYDSNALAAARVVLSIDLIVYSFILLKLLSVISKFGLKVKIIEKMVLKDLLLFIAILAVFFFSYTVASQAILYPNTDMSLKNIFKMTGRTYWSLFGETFLDEIEGKNVCTNNETLYLNDDTPRCPTLYGTYVVPILMGIYLLFTNILLLNMLVAMFSYTFKQVEKETKIRSCFHQFRMTLEYIVSPKLPAPFSIIEILNKWKKQGRNIKNESSLFRRVYSSQHELIEKKQLVKWENTIITHYFDTDMRAHDDNEIPQKDGEN